MMIVVCITSFCWLGWNVEVTPYECVERQMPVYVVLWSAFNLYTGQNTETFCQQKAIDNG